MNRRGLPRHLLSHSRINLKETIEERLKKKLNKNVGTCSEKERGWERKKKKNTVSQGGKARERPFLKSKENKN